MFKSQENKNHVDKNYYQINKYNSKNSACLEINFIKICPEIVLKYYFDKMWFYMKYIVNKSKVTNTYVHVLYTLIMYPSCSVLNRSSLLSIRSRYEADFAVSVVYLFQVSWDRCDTHCQQTFYFNFFIERTPSI
jgi:hypothetical protein